MAMSGCILLRKRCRVRLLDARWLTLWISSYLGRLMVCASGVKLVFCVELWSILQLEARDRIASATSERFELSGVTSVWDAGNEGGWDSAGDARRVRPCDDAEGSLPADVRFYRTSTKHTFLSYQEKFDVVACKILETILETEQYVIFSSVASRYLSEKAWKTTGIDGRKRGRTY